MKSFGKMPSRSSIVAEIDQQSPATVAAREALLDRAMGLNWKKKSSQKLRRGRRPSEGLAFVARDEDGVLVGTVTAVGRRRPATAGLRCCSVRSPSTRR